MTLKTDLKDNEMPSELIPDEALIIPTKSEPLCYHKYVIRHDLEMNMYYNCIDCGRVVFYWSADARHFAWPIS